MKAGVRLIRIVAIPLLAFALLACGNSKSNSNASTGSSASSSPTPTGNWSSLGVKTATDASGTASVNHDDYLTDSHAIYQCNDCHASSKPNAATGQPEYATRQTICVSCHPFSKYQSLAKNVDHAALGTGTQCNKCHYSNNGVSMNQGWRWPVGPISKTRIPHTQWHNDVKGNCLDCHTAANEPKYPANHATTNCQNCHYYSGGKWAGGAHPAVTTGCSTCHAAHPHTIAGTSVTAGTVFSGTGCETCHQPSIAGGYKNWLGAAAASFHPTLTEACLNCHSTAGIPTYPAGHYTSGCESCHSYNNGSWKGASGHPAVTTGCSSCHTKHYAGYSCEWCHTAVAGAGYKSWALSFNKHSHSSQFDSRACSACHSGSGFGG